MSDQILMDNYLVLHYKNKYRVKAHYDLSTNDFVRDAEGELDAEPGGREQVARSEELHIPAEGGLVGEHAVPRAVEGHADDDDDGDVHKGQHEPEADHHGPAKSLRGHSMSPPIAFWARAADSRTMTMMMLRMMSSMQESAAP